MWPFLVSLKGLFQRSTKIYTRIFNRIGSRTDPINEIPAKILSLCRNWPIKEDKIGHVTNLIGQCQRRVKLANRILFMELGPGWVAQALGPNRPKYNCCGSNYSSLHCTALEILWKIRPSYYVAATFIGRPFLVAVPGTSLTWQQSSVNDWPCANYKTEVLDSLLSA